MCLSWATITTGLNENDEPQRLTLGPRSGIGVPNGRVCSPCALTLVVWVSSMR
jgi:hypothetical protein